MLTFHSVSSDSSNALSSPPLVNRKRRRSEEFDNTEDITWKSSPIKSRRSSSGNMQILIPQIGDIKITNNAQIIDRIPLLFIEFLQKEARDKKLFPKFFESDVKFKSDLFSIPYNSNIFSTFLKEPNASEFFNFLNEIEILIKNSPLKHEYIRELYTILNLIQQQSELRLKIFQIAVSAKKDSENILLYLEDMYRYCKFASTDDPTISLDSLLKNPYWVDLLEEWIDNAPEEQKADYQLVANRLKLRATLNPIHLEKGVEYSKFTIKNSSIKSLPPLPPEIFESGINILEIDSCPSLNTFPPDLKNSERIGKIIYKNMDLVPSETRGVWPEYFTIELGENVKIPCRAYSSLRKAMLKDPTLKLSLPHLRVTLHYNQITKTLIGKQIENELVKLLVNRTGNNRDFENNFQFNPSIFLTYAPSNFLKFILLLIDTQLYKNPKLYKRLLPQLSILCEQIIKNPNFFNSVEKIAKEALGTCGDRITLGYSGIQEASITEKINQNLDFLNNDNAQSTLEELINTAKQIYRLKIIREAAQKFIVETKNYEEGVEYHLYYIVQCQKRGISLPGEIDDMTYSDYCKNGVTPDKIEKVYKKLTSTDNKDFLNFLITWEPTVKFYKRLNEPKENDLRKADIDKIKENAQEELDALVKEVNNIDSEIFNKKVNELHQKSENSEQTVNLGYILPFLIRDFLEGDNNHPLLQLNDTIALAQTMTEATVVG